MNKYVSEEEKEWKEGRRQTDGQERKEGEIISTNKAVFKSRSNLIGEIWSRFDEVGP